MDTVTQGAELKAVETPVKEESLSFKPEDFANDMAKLAAESDTPTTPTADTPAPIAEVAPTPPVQPEKATATPEATKVEVPEKFQKPDGSIDTEKLAKSTLSAEEALNKYLTMEKDLKRKQNELRVKDNPYLAQPAPQAPTAPQIPVDVPFSQRVSQDIAAQGVDPALAQALSPVLIKLFTAAEESAYERSQVRVNNLEQVSAENTTRQQVEAIGKRDPWVYTKEGSDALARILDEQPYLWNAKDPYKAAYVHYKGNQSVASQSVPQVSTATPTARPSAPVPTGHAAAPAPTPVILNTKAEIDAHLATLTPQQQSEFFKKQGFPGF